MTSDVDRNSRDALHRIGELAYFTDSAGDRLRIYDCAFGPPHCQPHRRRVMPLEDPRANHRYFVPELGVARVYRFAKNESRELTADRITEQLRGAGFAASTPPNVSAARPT